MFDGCVLGSLILEIVGIYVFCSCDKKSWKKLGAMPPEEAWEKYIAIVNGLILTKLLWLDAMCYTSIKQDQVRVYRKFSMSYHPDINKKRRGAEVPRTHHGRIQVLQRLASSTAAPWQDYKNHRDEIHFKLVQIMREMLLIHLRSMPQIVEGWNRSMDIELQPSQIARYLTKVEVKTKSGTRIEAPRKMSFNVLRELRGIGLEPPCFGLSLPHK